MAEENFNQLFNKVLTKNKEIADNYLKMTDKEKETFKDMFVISSAIMTKMQLS